jgi:hypothetical protein
VSRSLAFALWAFIVSPAFALLLLSAVSKAGADGSGTFALLFVVPATLALFGALRANQPNWVVALSPVISVVIALVGAFLIFAYVTHAFD